MSAFFLSSVFSALAAFGLMVAYGTDEKTAGVYATLGGLCLGIAAWAWEDMRKDRKRKQAQKFETEQTRRYRRSSDEHDHSED